MGIPSGVSFFMPEGGTEMHIDIIVTLAVAVFGSTGFWTWLMNRNKKKTAEARLLMGIAYSEIIRRSEHYIHKGYISVDEYNELNRYLFEPYQEMGGNGTAQKLMREVQQLPTSKEDIT